MKYHSRNRNHRSPNQKFPPPAPPNQISTQNPFPPRTNDFLPSEITTRNIKIAQAKSVFSKTQIDFLRSKIRFRREQMTFCQVKLPLTKSKSLNQNPFSLNPNWLFPKHYPRSPSKNDLLVRKNKLCRNQYQLSAVWNHLTPSKKMCVLSKWKNASKQKYTFPGTNSVFAEQKWSFIKWK